MASPIKLEVDIYLRNSKITEVAEVRRIIGVWFLGIARWLLKSELRIEEV